MPRALLAIGLALGLAGCATLPKPAQNSTPPAPAPLDRSAVMVLTATDMLGQPYRFGGAAPGGFDCSGLVVYAASAAGIRMPRTTQEQRQTGVPVSRRQLQPGDLVFMRLAHKELHVGIAIDGERFIHAPSTGGRVRIDSLAAAPYFNRFLEARRITGGAGDPPGG
ncbi:MAG: C40 family peptidase [Steroidobacteraceae bacterium]